MIFGWGGNKTSKNERKGRRGYFLFAFFCLLCFPVNKEASQSSFEFSLLDAAGQRHTAREWKGARAVVLFFIATECPISNRYSPEINRLVADYAARGVVFHGVHSDPDIGAEAVRRHAQDYGFRLPILLDPTQVLAGRAGVSLTPTVVILSPGGELLYRGRIDNRYLDYGKYRNTNIKPDLQLALEAALAGQRIAEPLTKPIGCALPPAKAGFTTKNTK
jgi:thiol-disulfide isomerase/thioredoxin